MLSMKEKPGPFNTWWNIWIPFWISMSLTTVRSRIMRLHAHFRTYTWRGIQFNLFQSKSSAWPNWARIGECCSEGFQASGEDNKCTKLPFQLRHGSDCSSQLSSTALLPCSFPRCPHFTSALTKEVRRLLKTPLQLTKEWYYLPLFRQKVFKESSLGLDSRILSRIFRDGKEESQKLPLIKKSWIKTNSKADVDAVWWKWIRFIS